MEPGPYPLSMGRGKPVPEEAPAREHFVVDFDGPDDPMNAQNWSSRKKVLAGAITCYTCLCSSFASSIFSTATPALSQHFHVGEEVTTLATGLFVLGYVFGPLVWGPLSELKGRKLPIVVGMFGFTVFAAGTAAGKDLQTVLLCRFFNGVMGSSPLTVGAGIFADMYDHAHRGAAVAIFAMCIFIGPCLAPFIGGFTVMSSLGWRWTGYWCLIMGALSFCLCCLFPETYAPTILTFKAASLRKKTGNWAIHAPQEEVEVSLNDIFTKYLARPLIMLVVEPVLFLISFYMSFVYGILYLFFESYPLVFMGVHRFNPGESGLPFFALGLGVVISVIVVVLAMPSYNRKLAANGGRPVAEWRLPLVMAGGISFTIGLFWFGWTGGNASIHWIVPTLSGLLTGFGFISIFMPLFNYIIDCYLMYAASAIAANTLMRSAAGAGFPMFANYMYQGLGIGQATTVCGCVAAALIPVPVIFYFYGAKLRERSKFAPTPPKPMPVKTDEESTSTDENEERKDG